MARWSLQPGTLQVSRQNHPGYNTNQDISAQMKFYSRYEYFQNHISNRRDPQGATSSPRLRPQAETLRPSAESLPRKQTFSS